MKLPTNFAIPLSATLPSIDFDTSLAAFKNPPAKLVDASPPAYGEAFGRLAVKHPPAAPVGFTFPTCAETNACQGCAGDA